MKRPLAVVGFALLGVLFVLCTLHSISLALLCALVSYVLFMITAIIPKTRKDMILPVAFFTCLIACCMFYGVQNDYKEMSDLAEKDAGIVCVVDSEPEFNKTYGRYYGSAKVKTIDGEKYRGNIRLSFNLIYDDLNLDDFQIGNILSFKGHIYNVGGEDSGIVDYFKSENIYIGVYGIEDFTAETPAARPVAYYGNALREFISKLFKDNFDSETAGFLTALLTGNKEYVSEDIYDSFKNAGVAHLMAVSGMHLAVLAMFINLFIRKLRKNHPKIYFVIMSLFVVFIMFTAAFSSSVTRAGIMLLTLLLGQCINKRADSLNSLGFACIVILVLNPFAAMSVGFLLSVLSTMAIIVFAVPFCNKHRYFLSDLLGLSSRVSFAVTRAVMFSIVVSLSVMVFTLPVMAVFFGRVSLISPVANLLFLPVNTVIIQLAFISSILCSLGIMPNLLISIIEKISSYFIDVADFLGGTDRFVLKVESLAGVIICCLVPFAVCLAIKVSPQIYKKIRNKKIKPL